MPVANPLPPAAHTTNTVNSGNPGNPGNPGNTAKGISATPIAAGKVEPPVAEMVARWMALGCLTTLLVVVMGFVAMGVVVGLGIFQ